MNSNELYHHGIKDQKWYVRRFQNKDGTLTPEGKERYRKKGEYYEADDVKTTIKKGKYTAKDFLLSVADVALAVAVKHYGAEFLLHEGHETAAVILDTFGNVMVGAAIGKGISKYLSKR